MDSCKNILQEYKKYIPPVWATFVGRELERSQILKFFSESQYPILLIYGARGVGKTSLAAFITNEHKDQFDVVVWIDRVNAYNLFDKLQSKDILDNVDVSKLGSLDSLSKIWGKTKLGDDEISFAYKTLMCAQKNNQKFLLIVDDVNEGELLGEDGSAQSLCRYIEEFVQYPNRAIITSRFREEHCFKGLGVFSIEIGVMSEADVEKIVRKQMEFADPVCLVKGDINLTCKYVWDMSHGLTEFVTRSLIPATVNQDLLLGRDPLLEDEFDAFAYCYLFTREQPYDDNNYKKNASVEHNKNISFIQDWHKESEFACFVLWKWLCLFPKEAEFSEEQLAKMFGVNINDPLTESKFHSALRFLFTRRVLLRKVYLCKGENDKREERRINWVFPPVVAKYLKKSLEKINCAYWEIEAEMLRDFILENKHNASLLVSHQDRIFKVVESCVKEQKWLYVFALGIQSVRCIDALLSLTNHTDFKNDFSYEIFSGICQRTIDAVEKIESAENTDKIGDKKTWELNVELWLSLAKIYSASGGNLKEPARQAATKARVISEVNQSSNMFFQSSVLLAKIEISTGNLKDAENYLLNSCGEPKNINRDWAIAAYTLAVALRMVNNLPESFQWYERVIKMQQYHLEVDITLQSIIDTVKYCLMGKEDSSKSIIPLLESIVNLIKENNYEKSNPNLCIRVYVCGSDVYELEKDIKKSKLMLQSALEICKDDQSVPEHIFRKIRDQLIVLNHREQDKPISLLDEIDAYSIAALKNNYLDDLLGVCPVCREDLLTSSATSCSSCHTQYHKECAVDIGKCVVCSSKFVYQEQML